jgi:hypothetical protein
MLKMLLAAFLCCAAPAIGWSEPIKYIATFAASGTLTASDGTAHPFDGTVVLSISADTTKVRKVFEDGEFGGFQTLAPLNIFIEGLGSMKSLVDIQAYSVRNSLELDGYVDNVLLPTFVFSYSGFYNLQSSFVSKGSWDINYFNMGIIPTTKGRLQFSVATSNGGLAGDLND